MKFYHELAFSDAWLTPEENQALLGLNSAAKNRNGYGYSVCLDAPEGDSFIKLALTYLKNHGIPRQMTANSSAYGYTVMRQYEKEEFAEAEYLIVSCQRRLNRDKEWKMHRAPIRDPLGRLLILAGDATSDLKIATAHWPDNMVVVSDEVRAMLESGGLVGPQFGEVAVKGKSSKISPRPFWELQSSIRLPKIANTHQLVHPGSAAAEPFCGDYSRRVMIDDSPFVGGELHYRRSDLATLGAFDIAIPFEKIWYSQPLVISQRFYRHCLKHEIVLEVLPVRIDEEPSSRTTAG